MATPKEAHALVSYFGKQYKERYGIQPKLNRYTARWGFDPILMDMSSEDIKGLIDYYFETVSTNGHALNWFFSNYEKLADAREKRDQDEASLRRIREETRKRTEEWRKRLERN